MAEERTVTIDSPKVLTFEANRAGMTEDGWLYQFVNGHLNALNPAYLASVATASAKEAETMKSKYDALKVSDPTKAAEVDALLATAAVETPGDEEPVG